jgi:hypothetical protein
MLLEDRRVPLQQALSSVAADAPEPVLSLEAPLGYSHRQGDVDKQQPSCCR